MLLTELVETSEAVATAPGRRAKIAEIAGLLRQVPAAEVSIAVAFLSGELRQRQIGVGYAALMNLLRADRSAPQPTPRAAEDPPAQDPAAQDPPAEPSLTLTDTDAAFEAIGAVAGPGSQAGAGCSAACSAAPPPRSRNSWSG